MICSGVTLVSWDVGASPRERGVAGYRGGGGRWEGGV